MALLISQTTLANEKTLGVYFISPQDGEKVGKTFAVKMGLRGMEVRPAGEMAAQTGHHHLIIDGSPIQKGQVVPKDARHLHFGGGQSETTVTLPPGKHRLTLQFADGSHLSYGPKWSKTIQVLVEDRDHR